MGNIGICDASEQGDGSRYRRTGVDQGVKLPNHHPASHLDGSDLSDSQVRRSTTSGLEVYYTEVNGVQRCPEIVDGQGNGTCRWRW
jgi:hypothetical protein